MFVSSDWVRCVAFDPQNPNILASCSNDKTIKIWDITSGSCLSTLIEGRRRVSAAGVVSGHDGKDGCICDCYCGILKGSVNAQCPVRGHRYVPSL